MLLLLGHPWAKGSDVNAWATKHMLCCLPSCLRTRCLLEHLLTLPQPGHQHDQHIYPAYYYILGFFFSSWAPFIPRDYMLFF